MSDFDVKERRFEEDIEDYLIHHGGYEKGNPATFNRVSGLDEGTFIEFIKNSQPKQWERFVKIYDAMAEKQIIERFSREVKQTSLLNVLRHGFTDRGIKFRAIFWKPETSLNETSKAQYEANILHCTRQLHYSVKNENSIDIVLFINGIPVVSMELKCQFTGQSTTNAINQYKFDRASKDTIFAFKKRVLVHFAVDLTNVYMTTRLEGAHTYFLPFNQGSAGAGNVGGKGNPNNENGYDTAYLWENVLCKDRLLEILQKYMHLQQEFDDKGNLKSERMIFPRYHQLDVVTKLLADVKENGSGKNYLIQHSAGSGKSNSIAWLAHRLAGLHNDMDEKIFQSVIIVTDRRVLDSQLQSTVYQFDHVEGVVQKIDKNSQQLKDAIESGAGIIITTLQKFPVIYKEVNSANKRFAIIVDEAHSSQTGDAARKLKRALADTEEILKEYAEMEEEDEKNRKDDEDRLLDELAAQGIHENLSFFAFTATPKGKTLQMFGTKDAEGVYHPFHIYSMRQAIEEHFILDVLQNYMTYKMYYKITKIIDDDPELDTTQGSKAILNYETLHPHNISQKTAIMLYHFMNITRHKMGGKAKAMVVTPSRLHAVRYVQEFKRQIEEKGYDLDVLVAFSGEVTDDGVSYTEEGMNKDKNGQSIKEKALPGAFHTDDYGILVVAEKYQTGFDEPLLHTMFVDKKLSGVKAVQTLSRLNRTARGKLDTFVLDFVNSAEDIKASFEPFYEETVLLEETDPNVVYDMKNTLDEFRVYQTSEIEKFADIFYSNETQSAGDLGKLQGQLRPAVDRYVSLEVERQDLFKSTLAMFNRVYAYITQVCRLFDKDIHKFSVYSKFLYTMLPKGQPGEKVSVDDKILLEYYKLEKDFEGSIELEGSDGGYVPISGDAGHREPKKDPLTAIIDKINERFGTAFTEMDKVLVQMENDYANQEKWQSYAKNNDRATFMLLFEKDFPTMAADRYEQNDEFFRRLFGDPEMMKQVMDTVGSVLYERLKKSFIYDPKSGVIDEATPETYVEDIYAKTIK